jgi:CheY-like chemotaxis protein
MPGTDGREVLREVKSDPGLRNIPVIVLTTASDDRSVDECYRLGANSFIPKPVTIEGFFNAIQRLKDYWFEVVILPKG